MANRRAEPQFRRRSARPVPSCARSANRCGFPCRPSGRRSGLHPPHALHACRGTVGMPPPSGHPRQPNGSPRSIPPGSAAGLRTVFWRAGSIGMNVRNGAVRPRCPRSDRDTPSLQGIFQTPGRGPRSLTDDASGWGWYADARAEMAVLSIRSRARQHTDRHRGHLRVRDAHNSPSYRKKRRNAPVSGFGQVRLGFPSTSSVRVECSWKQSIQYPHGVRLDIGKSVL